MLDLLIRGGTLIDGSGGEPIVGDLGIADGRIVSVGPRGTDSARRELDAEGALVTPGFVDVHTHYDAQVHWDPLVSPSSEHGVTTLVVGNCGLGLAPVRPGDRRALQGLLGGVEDIPQSALDAGLSIRWEDYPGYLKAIDEEPRSVDVAALVGHAALRLYAMGPERAFAEAANDAEIAAMGQMLAAGLAAGALGFSTSRSRLDRDFEGRTTPTCFATDRETEALGGVLAASGRGVFQLVFRGAAGDEPERLEEELAFMRRLAASTRRPVTFGLAQLDAIPERWQRVFEVAGEARNEGLALRPQTLGRMQTILIGLETVHPFAYRPSYRAIMGLPLGERVARMRDPELRGRILREESGQPSADDPYSGLFSYAPERIFPIEATPDYEPGPEKSLAALARAQGRPPLELFYDLLLEEEGRRLFFFAVANYHGGDHAVAHAMLAHPASLVGLADGGAHSGMICDTGQPTFLLTHWGRDRARGPRFPMAEVVRRLSGEPAAVFGLGDRGRLAPGLRADVNVIDPSALALLPPRIARDLPAGARRLVQGARGYVATSVAGVQRRADGAETGARPGRLARAR
ncbi:MAG: amidohydrolase family protein [Deltaproteobacteria bacterium]|nr:amidohydrolase family protein [Deltaproteobacteria bacterium]